MPLTIVKQDITKLATDAIVNATNTSLEMGGGVCGAIFKAAGPQELAAACKPLGPIQVGEAVITPGFNLAAKFIIHTAGSTYQGGGAGESEKLRQCYLNSLKLAVENNCESIAFPLISTGIYRYPKEEALVIAAETIVEFLAEYDLSVYLAFLDVASVQPSRELLIEVEYYLTSQLKVGKQYQTTVDMLYQPVIQESAKIENLIENLAEPFSTFLLHLIDEKGKSDVEVYKKANIDRKHFSKIRTNPDYKPSKRTALALAIGLELSLPETEELLQRAGYALSSSDKFDVIIEYFITQGNYDIHTINQVLFRYEQPLLGA